MSVLKSTRDGKAVAYKLGDSVTIGSGLAAQINIPNGNLAPRHCQIARTAQGFVVSDVSGGPGTYVNGKKIQQHLLKDRDVIQIGTERFSFAAQAGENTARIAGGPPPAASAKSSGATARVAVPAAAAAAAPARSGNTARMAAAPPPAASPTKTTRSVERIVSAPPPPPTQRMPAASTGRVPTGAVKTTSGRMGKAGGSTRKMTARMAAASAGIKTERAAIALPTTRKGKLIALGGALGVAGLIGILVMVKMREVNPEQVKKDLAAAIDQINKLPKDQIRSKYQKTKELIDDPLYQKYGAGIYLRLTKAYQQLEEQVRNLDKADKEVKPFLGDYALAKKDPEAYDKKSQALYDTANALLGNYGSTLYQAELEKIRDELKVFIGNKGNDNWEKHYYELGAQVQKKMKEEHDYAGAYKLVDEFGTQWKEADDPQLHKKLEEEQRGRAVREADAHVEKAIRDHRNALKDDDAGKKEDTWKVLEASKAGLSGEKFKKSLDKLEAYLREHASKSPKPEKK
jgi:hypothetical protein